MTTTAAPLGTGTGRVSSDRQSRRSAWPASHAAEANWSMIPQFIPTYRFSAFCPSFAMRTASHAVPVAAARARAVASSSAAEDERPAPIGTSPSTTTSRPRSGSPSEAKAQKTPATYESQSFPPGARSASSASSFVSSYATEWPRRTRSARGRKATTAARPMAMGRTKPSL